MWDIEFWYHACFWYSREANLDRSLSRVERINETLLIISHDGYYDEMSKIIQSIRFCQVKQIFSPFSPHLFSDSFPGVSPSDCKDQDDPAKKHCQDTKDQYGNHCSPKIVYLKHHWWWMMNTVWDGLKETYHHSGHILFIEEDHFIFPNAYRNLQLLAQLEPVKCPHCYALNLAPSNVKFRGEGWESLIAERMGNVGYAFNGTVCYSPMTLSIRNCDTNLESRAKSLFLQHWLQEPVLESAQLWFQILFSCLRLARP